MVEFERTVEFVHGYRAVPARPCPRCGEAGVELLPTGGLGAVACLKCLLAEQDEDDQRRWAEARRRGEDAAGKCRREAAEWRAQKKKTPRLDVEFGGGL